MAKKTQRAQRIHMNFQTELAIAIYNCQEDGAIVGCAAMNDFENYMDNDRNLPDRFVYKPINPEDNSSSDFYIFHNEIKIAVVTFNRTRATFDRDQIDVYYNPFGVALDEEGREVSDEYFKKNAVSHFFIPSTRYKTATICSILDIQVNIAVLEMF